MREIDNNQIKPMLLGIMKDVHLFCAERGYRYWLVSGTLLGAIRHNGFIPWDDDIDIWMPRPDYDRFVREYRHNHYSVLDCYCDAEYPLDYAKVQDKRTLVVETGGDGNWGISIDIFPLDGLPDVKTAEKMFNKTRLFRRLVSNQRFTRKMNLSRENGLSKNIGIFCGKLIHPFVKFNSLLLQMDCMMKKYDFDKTNYCGCLCWRKLIFEQKMLVPVLHTFEDAEFIIPEDYDSVLKIIFNNYMELPPVEQRVSNHGIKAYWRE